MLISFINDTIISFLVFRKRFFSEYFRSNEEISKSNKLLDILPSVNEEEDVNKGCSSIGNRMMFYSTRENAIFISKINDLHLLMGATNDQGKKIGIPKKIVPFESLEAMTDFNGNIITFTPTGIDRWLLSHDDKKILQRDPTFHYDHSVRFEGGFVKSNRNLYYYTDDLNVYKLNSRFVVSSLFEGSLPVYYPISKSMNKGYDLPMAAFKMLGYEFVSVGPWLFNTKTSTWSTYSFDGYKKPAKDMENKKYIFENQMIGGCVTAGKDDLICNHSSIGIPMSYNEMSKIDLENIGEPSWIEGEYNYGELAFFETRMYQELQTFSLDDVMAYVSGGILKPGDAMYLKVIVGDGNGDFDEDDEKTYGIPAYYSPMSSDTLGEGNHVGRFVWPKMNIKTDRFRLKVIVKHVGGLVIQSVFANITHMNESDMMNNPDN
ncbi:MAG: hypothetical protein P0S93_02660 [Candidatus Neptunochlamydia sp.]|nr:hypothetical protein [Candidatus Neptunochlamydia sp.]